MTSTDLLAGNSGIRDTHADVSPARPGIMQVTDTLIAGGLERVAVNLANALPVASYRSHLCTTRREGPLAELIAPHVGRLRLQRDSRFDVQAFRHLIRYLRENRIQILHAHGTGLFLSVLASFFQPHPLVLWHNHGGWLAGLERSPWWLRLLAKRVDEIVVVNRPLRDWCIRALRMPADRVRYIPNFVCVPDDVEAATGLPGKAGFRIASVANLLPPKDPVNLLRAMKIVARTSPDAHLLMVGRNGDSGYMKLLFAECDDPILRDRVSFLGVRSDVPAILKACNIGVLSSASEGFPLALVEYGVAGLPAVATRVGQCEEILNGGRVGLLVPPSAPEKLAQALLWLLESSARRIEMGERFRTYVQQTYSAERIIQQVCGVYQSILNPSKGEG